jgi:Transglutaminase-like superfamily
VVDLLVAAGLSTPDADGTARFDYVDLMNLGLLSGTGRSLPELSERQCMRIAAGPPESWLPARDWRLRLEARCEAAGCAAPVTVLRPGGTGDGAAAVCRGWEETGDGPAATVELLVTTTGSAGQVRTPAVREMFTEVVEGLRGGRYTFAWLPQGLRADVDAALARGTLDCVATSLLLARWCGQAGVPARTRTGFLLGMVGVEHGWLEVREDGRWLPVDPLLAYLAGRHPGSDRAFAGFCLGSRSNRVLAWDRPAGAELAQHRCTAGRVTVTCRQFPNLPPGRPP